MRQLMALRTGMVWYLLNILTVFLWRMLADIDRIFPRVKGEERGSFDSEDFSFGFLFTARYLKAGKNPILSLLYNSQVK
ncbi:MAG: hypothetical protein ACETWC_03115 [Acidobacteriota bacterium]